MPDKLDDIKKWIGFGTGIGKHVAPGGLGRVLDMVNKGLQDDKDPHNEEAIKVLTDAILVLDERITKLEGK